MACFQLQSFFTVVSFGAGTEAERLVSGETADAQEGCVKGLPLGLRDLGRDLDLAGSDGARGTDVLDKATRGLQDLGSG